MIIRSILVIPKTEKKSFDQDIAYFSKSLNTTKEQLIIINRALQMQSFVEQLLEKEKIAFEIEKINSTSNKLSKEKLLHALVNNKIINQCSHKIILDKFEYKRIHNNTNQNLFKHNNTKILNSWYHFTRDTKSKRFTVKNYHFFNYKFQNHNLLLSIGCNKRNLNPTYGDAKKNLKDHINKNLLIDSQLASAQIAFFWVNPKIDIKSDKILLEKNLKKNKNTEKKYQISDISTVPNIPTGNLTIKQVFDSLNKKPIEHTYEGKELITWTVDLSAEQNNEYFLLSYTIEKKELLDKNKMKVMFLLPETFLAILISFILIFFLFKRILKNMKVLDTKVTQKTQQLEKSLVEKEILLKEIHHRVKNNLALTISLLELQEEEITDDKTKKVLVDIQERIYTMELLHRKLYESTDLNQISFKNYINDLTDAIAKSYDRENNVFIDINMQEVYLSIEKAMSYGLLLNELITNAFKYAFKDNKNPIFEITVTQNEEDILLVVKDNGEGLAKDFNEICHDTLGLKLINMIVRYQLFGTIRYEYKEGAMFIITAPLKKLV